MQFTTGTSAPTAPPADPNLPAQFYNTASKFTYEWNLGTQTWVVIPKVYRALVSQEGTAIPTVVVVENSLAVSIEWQRIGPGVFVLIATPDTSFTPNRTGVTVGPLSSVSGSIQKEIYGSGWILLEVDNPAGVATDGLLANTELAISVYP